MIIGNVLSLNNFVEKRKKKETTQHMNYFNIYYELY